MIVTVPDAPPRHVANPNLSTIAMVKSELLQPLEYGGINGTVAGDGCWLNLPVAVNGLAKH